MIEQSPNRKRAKVLSLLLALSLAAAACGSGAAADDSAPDTEDVAAADTTDDSAEDGDGAEDETGEAADGETADDDDATDDDETVTVTIENVSGFAITDSGVFNTPAGGTEPGPALPGDAYEFSFYAQPGQRLSFATMFVQTNDWFFAPDPAGIELFDADGNPISGDVTDQILTFDAGTEVDQTPGEGVDQAPRQAGPNVGDADPDTDIRTVDRDAANYVGVLITPAEGGRFDVRVENVSQMATTPSPIAPGVYAVHSPDVSLFTVGGPDDGNGLEELAEDGDAAVLGDYLRTLTGTPTPIAPGVWAVHDDDVSLYEIGAADAGQGHEALAEDGDPSVLADSLSGLAGVNASGAFNTPDGASEPGPVLPGSSYSFEVPVVDGRLSFTTMFVQSNDWVFATPPEGLALADLDGDITDQLLVVDVGTEVDQLPGFGADQAPRQDGPDTGADDENTSARPVEGRSASRYISVTATR